MSNDDLGAALASLLAAADPVPAAALRAAYSAIGWRDLDSELAQLMSDTAGDRELAHLRGQSPRLLTFTAGGLTIDLEVSAEAGAVRLLGQLDPPVPATITAQSAASSTATQADSRGRFSLDALAARMRVVVDFGADDRKRATTEWFLP